jgi:hypothetical protein
MNIANTLVAMIHDRVGDTLASFLSGGDNPFFIKPSDTLLGQLEDPTVTVPRMSAGFIGDIAVTSVSGLVGRLRTAGGDAGKLLDQVRDALRGQLFRPPAGGANAPEGAIEGLVHLLETDAQDIRQAATAFQQRINTILENMAKTGPADAGASVARVKQILGNDIGTLIPLATLANAMRGVQNAADVPHSIEQGLLAYFFSADGYKTVDSETVVAPVHLSDLESIAAGLVSVGPGPDVRLNRAPLKQIKGLVTTATAEQYLRDTIRVIVESAYDALRGFGDAAKGTGRYGTVVSKLKARKPKPADQETIVSKFVTWFRGFSSMAESGAMRAVEIGTQGVAEFQTNPLVAAAAGAFAGAVARKIAQDAFLGLMTDELAKA